MHRLVLVHDGLETSAPHILAALKDAGLRVMLISREDLAVVAPADVVLLRLADRDPVSACWRIHRQGHRWIVALATDPQPDECIRLLNAGADGYIANHPYRDQTFVDGKDDKITRNRARKPGDPSPWIGRSTYIRYMLISLECTEALTGWVQAGRPRVSQ